MESSASESKAFQRGPKGKIPGPAWQKKTAEPLQIETGVPNQFRRRIFYVLNSMYPISLVKSTASEPGLSVYKKR